MFNLSPASTGWMTNIPEDVMDIFLRMMVGMLPFVECFIEKLFFNLFCIVCFPFPGFYLYEPILLDCLSNRNILLETTCITRS